MKLEKNYRLRTSDKILRHLYFIYYANDELTCHVVINEIRKKL